MKMYIIYNEEVAIWVYEEEAYEKMANGWVLYGYALDENKADELCEEACYAEWEMF
ncbi:hypothetical protein Q7A53_05645 [Halobacillus rhizosphaerae]|uniref:hypothetical protein n=1 Tax=Halobacillus rhizosphaerae TaxID=3064889 RepID=UPI00398AA588